VPGVAALRDVPDASREALSAVFERHLSFGTIRRYARHGAMGAREVACE